MMRPPSPPVSPSASTPDALSSGPGDDADSAPDDGALLADYVREDSPAAFRSLTERFTGLVYGVARRRTGSHEIAEEVTQNVFAILARKAPGLVRKEIPPGPWLHRAAVLESCQAMRRENTRQRIMKSFAASHEMTGPAENGPLDSALSDLDEALDQLPRPDRELLFSRYFDGLSYRELAATTRRSEAALMQQHHRALQKLSRLFRRSGHAVTATALAAGLRTPLASAAPSGLAATCTAHATSAAATAAAASLNASTLFQLALAMQTKTSFAVLITMLCLIAGAGSFLAARRVDEAIRGPSFFSAPRASGTRQFSEPNGNSKKVLPVIPTPPIPSAAEVLTAERHERIEKLALWLTTASPAGMGEMLENFDAMSYRPTVRLQKELILQRWMEVDREGAFAACRKSEGYNWLACIAWGRLNPREAWQAAGETNSFDRQNVLKGIIEADPVLAEELLKEAKGSVFHLDSHLHTLIADQLAARNPRAAWEYALRNEAYAIEPVKEWVREDPEAAIAFVLGQPSTQQRMGPLSSLLGELQRQHPEKIGPLLESLPEGRLKWQALAQQTAWLTGHDPAAALDLARQKGSPATRALILQEMANTLVKTKPQEALRLLRELDWNFSGNETSRPEVITASTPAGRFGESKAAEALFKLTEGGHLDDALTVASSVPPGTRRDQALGAVASGWPAERVYELSAWTAAQNEPSVRAAGARRIVDHLMADKEPDFEAATRWAASLTTLEQAENAPLVNVMRKWRASDRDAAESALQSLTLPANIRDEILKPEPAPQ